jgi:hypothetical protein
VKTFKISREYQYMFSELQKIRNNWKHVHNN